MKEEFADEPGDHEMWRNVRAHKIEQSVMNGGMFFRVEKADGGIAEVSYPSDAAEDLTSAMEAVVEHNAVHLLEESMADIGHSSETRDYIQERLIDVHETLPDDLKP